MSTCQPTIVVRPGQGSPTKGPDKVTTICCSKVYSQTLFLGCSIKSFNASLGWGGEASTLTVELVYDNCNYPKFTDISGKPVEIDDTDNHYTDSRLNNNFTKDNLGNSIIPSKVYYAPRNGKLVSKYWPLADPGFYGDMPNPADTVDIMGCAVYFKYDDFEFNGIVKNWQKNGGTGGQATYSVTIESPAFLLKQTQMILGDYNGAIFVKGLAPNFPDHGFPMMEKGQYMGNIIEQAIPNVINIYGYLEDNTNLYTNLPIDDYNVPVYSYGRSGRNDEGLQANLILLAIDELLNSTLPDTKQKILRYSPFGRIIGISPKYKTTGSDLNFTPIVFDLNAPVLPQLNSIPYYFGLVEPTPYPPSLVKRTGYTIDVSDITKNGIIPEFYRFSESKLSILEFLENLCDNTGQQLFITLDLQFGTENNIYPRIKINTISTLLQPQDGAVQSYINSIAGTNSIVTSYSKGEEYNNTAPVRTMIVGGKQQRLYQVKNSKYAIKQNVLRYNAYTDSFMQHNHFGAFESFQQYRFPDTANIRCPSLYIDNTQPVIISSESNISEIKANVLSAGSLVGIKEPTINIIVQPPISGSGTAAKLEAVIETKDLGQNCTFDETKKIIQPSLKETKCSKSGSNFFEYSIKSVKVSDPGQGYAYGENLSIQVNGIPGAFVGARTSSSTNINKTASSFIRVALYSTKFGLDNSWGWQSSKNIKRGNYLPSYNFGPVGQTAFVPGGLEYPSSDSDAICPYFGTNDITGSVRRVTSHYGKFSATGGPVGGGVGFLVHFTTNEIGAAIGRPFAINDSVRISETEIRAAISSFDAYIGFIAGVISDTGGGGLDIWTKVLVPIIGPYRLRTMMNGLVQVFNKFNNSQSGSQTVPNNAVSSVLTDPLVNDVITKLYNYFKKIGDEFYGKKYMVSIPSPQYWIDRKQFDPSYIIGYTSSGSPIYLSQGSQKTYFSFQPTDFAWEEPFNYIDDSLVVGNSEMDIFTKEDGSIEPILGYNNSPQFNYAKSLSKLMSDWSKITPVSSEFIEFWKYDAFRSAGIGSPDGFNAWEPSLVVQNKNVLAKPYNNITKDSFGTILPANYGSKLYAKATVEKEFKLMYTSGGTLVPKIIVSTEPIYLNHMNPDSLSVQTAIAEFLAEDYTDMSMVNRARKILSANNYYNSPINPAALPSSTFNGSNLISQNKDNKQYNNLSISPKAAVPGFAAIPIIMNDACYGPWISAPDLIKSEIFSDPLVLPEGIDAITIKNNKLENLTGGVNLEINTELVPWNYGGMRVLDEAAGLLAGQNNNYQLRNETGNLVIQGVPQFRIGDELKAITFAFRGPTINNIQVQISDNGVSTTYTFRTFTKKFTLFNKESSDRLKTIGQNSIKLSREYRLEARNINERIRAIGLSPTISSYDLTGSKLRQYSPMSILVGYSSPFLSPRSTVPPQFYQMSNWTGDSIRQSTEVTLQDFRELSQEFEHQYSSKSFMSLDGLLHPVSFYPSLNNSTTPYKKYYTSTDRKISGCPICGGTKQYSFSINSQEEPKILYCDFCSDDIAGTETGDAVLLTDRLPPYILSDAADETIIEDPLALKNLLQSTVLSKRINYVNLNPIIMPVGELRNKYAQNDDYNAHHIEVVGRSLVPPLGSISISDNLAIPQPGGLEYKDQNALDSDGDWNAYAFDIDTGRSNPKIYQNNMRFLALRGPLVMAGWGFDTDGFPVPNASGEAKELNEAGYPKRIKNLQDQEGGFESYEGTILGKNQEWDTENERWTEPVKEKTFAKGWGLRPDTWPVGPVDLRWDDTRKVWTTPQPYKFVDIVLEDNLVPNYPARGFLYGVDKENPLPNGLRRMIFVKDSSQNYGAPRGAKILCYYDESTGFYEPINKNNIITSGLIQDTGKATIYNGYAKGYDLMTGELETPDPIDVEYHNILNFSITQNDQPGFFMFDKTGWVLISTNPCS